MTTARWLLVLWALGCGTTPDVHPPRRLLPDAGPTDPARIERMLPVPW
jgi:hypothetical protein